MSLFLAALFLFSIPSNASDAPPLTTEKVEVLIGHVFVKKWGYRPSDYVQVVVDGYLPNSCTHLDETQIDPVVSPTPDPSTSPSADAAQPQSPAATHQFEAHQFALQSPGVNCALGIVPYSITKSLGQLPVGNYEIHFNVGSVPPLSATFEVSEINDEQIHGALPIVTDAKITNTWSRSNAKTIATLTGELPSLCTQIQKLQVLLEDDVVVVNPILTSSSEDCPQIPRPFQSSVSLGNLEDGRYLLEVGSAHGDLLKTFGVLKGDL
jgi:hypothetical protein